MTTTSLPSVREKENEAPWPCGGKSHWWNHVLTSGHYRNGVSSATGRTEVVDMCDGQPYQRARDYACNGYVRPGSCVPVFSPSYPEVADMDYLRETYPGAFR